MPLTTKIVYRNSDDVAVGIVISQSPAVGQAVPTDGQVTIFVSKGPIQLKQARFLEARDKAVFRVIS